MTDPSTPMIPLPLPFLILLPHSHTRAPPHPRTPARPQQRNNATSSRSMALPRTRAKKKTGIMGIPMGAWECEKRLDHNLGKAERRRLQRRLLHLRSPTPFHQVMGTGYTGGIPSEKAKEVGFRSAVEDLKRIISPRGRGTPETPRRGIDEGSPLAVEWGKKEAAHDCD